MTHLGVGAMKIHKLICITSFALMVTTNSFSYVSESFFLEGQILSSSKEEIRLKIRDKEVTVPRRSLFTDFEPTPGCPVMAYVVDKDITVISPNSNMKRKSPGSSLLAPEPKNAKASMQPFDQMPRQ